MNAPAFGFAKPARPIDFSRFVTGAQRTLRDEGYAGAANDIRMISAALQAGGDALADRDNGDNDRWVAERIATAIEAAGYLILSRDKAVIGLVQLYARQFHRENCHG
ncbi:hypothetical protein [Sphingomonas oryzagri]|uniref:Uncharacterized protein n=1 Tax=Sphingomonas oryzagri TaxID=3042314 RepID=A0ABT6N7T3_9SPHN|nr:hypothetical protein [Sphingomonas oryzagri]MDH7641174.1 hypothetical protein [Sphingomonas oryzagri]